MNDSSVDTRKLAWSGRIMGIGPRIRLWRSFDQSQHSYLGYVLRVEGTIGNEDRSFLIAVGEGAHKKHQFRAGMVVSGVSAPVEDPRNERAGFYKTSGIRIEQPAPDGIQKGPPFMGVPPGLEIYRSRGCRRLDPGTYEAKCALCTWGCEMPVEMIVDHWKPSNKRYQTETFCYGPKSCPFYRAGANRKVPGRKGMVHVEEDWVDEEATSHRGPDD